jgi:signal peptidase I
MGHDTLPVVGVPSYLNKPQLPYFRLPGFTKVDRKDIVVFSWPADTVRRFFKREAGVKKPIDKKSNYVKRCVGIPGDSLEVRNGYVFVNGKQLELPGSAKPQFDYTIYSNKGVSSRLLDKIGVTDFTRKYLSNPLNQQQAQVINQYLLGYNQGENGQLELYTKSSGIPPATIKKFGLSLREVTDRERVAPLTSDMVTLLRNDSSIDSVVQNITPKGMRGTNLFPQSPDYPWNYSQLGPIYIPKKGTTVDLSLKTLPLYKKIIREYEGNTVSVTGNQIKINDEVVNSYTFKQDYYWMMGDNRDHSEDSRAWGYVPENHIVGTPIFIWMSFDNFTESITNWRPRWNRIFTTVNGEGEPQSYFKYFLILLVAYFVGSWLWKRKKSNEA